MKLKVKHIDIEAGNFRVALLNRADAAELGVMPTDRVTMTSRTNTTIAIVDTTEKFVSKGEIGLFGESCDELVCVPSDFVDVLPTAQPLSLSFIKRKLEGAELNHKEIRQIIEDVVRNKLGDAEASFFMGSAYAKPFSDEETISLTKAMVEYSDRLKFDKHPIVDKHSIGGIPGNRATMIVVPIIAAAGLTMPKTSARAITSASGTADAMEVLAPVSLSIEEATRVVEKTNGCMIWGGGLNLVPADDKLNRLRYSLRLDPKPFLIASVLAKKAVVGAEKVVIDMPVGHGAKLKDINQAKELSHSFIVVGSRLGMDIQCVITPGDKPIGLGIGPALEARDVLNVLQNRNGPADLKEKGLSLAGLLLEMGGKAEHGSGYAIASEILSTGKAWQKMREIIAAQGGKADVRSEDIPVGKHKVAVTATADTTVYGFENDALTKIARSAGSPAAKGAGVLLRVTRGQFVKKGQTLFEIYAESEAKLDEAMKVAKEKDPIVIERPVLGVYGP